MIRTRALGLWKLCPLSGRCCRQLAAARREDSFYARHLEASSLFGRAQEARLYHASLLTRDSCYCRLLPYHDKVYREQNWRPRNRRTLPWNKQNASTFQGDYGSINRYRRYHSR